MSVQKIIELLEAKIEHNEQMVSAIRADQADTLADIYGSFAREEIERRLETNEHLARAIGALTHVADRMART